MFARVWWRVLEQGYAISSLCNTRPYNLTGVPVMTLTEIGHAITKIPDDFMAHPKVLDLYERRRMNLDAGKVDMAMAELLAAGTSLVASENTCSKTSLSSDRLFLLTSRQLPSFRSFRLRTWRLWLKCVFI